MTVDICAIARRRFQRALGFILAGLALTLIAGQFASYPSQVWDIEQNFNPDVFLKYPKAYTFFAPFFQAADLLTILSLNQHIAMILFLNGVWILIRLTINFGGEFYLRKFFFELLKWVGFNAAYACIGGLVILAPRPMAWLEVQSQDRLIVDFHSHTNHSWDARKSFSPLRNLAWHKRGGFHAAFITDHNTTSGVQEALHIPEQYLNGAAVPLRGEEVSLFQSHWVVLGNKNLIPNQKYDTGMEGIRAFLSDLSRSSDVFVIASLPEYWLYHWGDGLDQFIQWGAQGFEAANSAPQALDFPQSYKKSIIQAGQDNQLALTGITDTHGWGSTIYAWNIMDIPEWRSLSRDDLELEIVKTLRRNGTQAVRCWTRVKQEPPIQRWKLAFDPVLQVWRCARAMPGRHRAVSLLWITAFAGLYAASGKQKKSVKSTENLI